MRCTSEIFAALALLAASPAISSPETDTAMQKELSAYMDARASVNDFSGSVLVSRSGKRLLVRGYGQANREWSVPNTPSTKFRIGSLTKGFTAALIMQLHERGLVDLGASVCSYLSPCPVTWKPVTVHQLLSHTGGIHSFTDDPEFADDAARNQARTAEQVISLFRDRPLDFAPGTRWHYSNAGYILLGRIIERLLGSSYEVALHDRVLQPLGMADSGYDHVETILSQRASGYAFRDGKFVNATAINTSWLDAAGALYSTVLDLEKWGEALDSEAILSDCSKALMWTPVRNDYGYGWAILSEKHSTAGQLEITHDGSVNGFSSHMSRFPKAHVVVIVLSNVGNGRADIVAQSLSAIVFHKPYDWPTQPISRVDPIVLDRWVGTYDVDANGLWEFTRDGDRLYVRVQEVSEQQKFELVPITESTFRLQELEAQIEFVSTGKGIAPGLKVRQAGKTRLGRRITGSPAP